LLTHVSFLLEDYQSKLDADGIGRLRRLAYLAQRMDKLINDLLNTLTRAILKVVLVRHTLLRCREIKRRD